MWFLAMFLMSGFMGDAYAQATGWRYDGTGIYAAQNPLTNWDVDTNIRWQVAMPDFSNGSPVLWSDMLFVVSEPVSLIALSAVDGRELWKRSNRLSDTLVGEEKVKEEAERARFDSIREDLEASKQDLYRMKRRLRRGAPEAGLLEAVNNFESRVNELHKSLKGSDRYQPLRPIPLIGYSSSTPAVDESGIYAIFGNGVLTHFDMEGTRSWSKMLGESPKDMLGFNEGHAASPIIIGGHLLVGFSRLRSFNKTTGEIFWEGRRFRDFGTPVHVQVGGQDFVATGYGEIYRLSDGALLKASLGDLRHSGRVASGDVLYGVRADFARGTVRQSTESSKKAPAMAQARRVSVNGEKLAVEELWNTEVEVSDYYATPLVYENILYAVSAKGVITALDAATGAIHYRRELSKPGEVFASPSAAGGYIFVTDSTGVVWVLRAGPTGEVVNTNFLPDRVLSSLSFGGGLLFFRGHDVLYAIGGKP